MRAGRSRDGGVHTAAIFGRILADLGEFFGPSLLADRVEFALETCNLAPPRRLRAGATAFARAVSGGRGGLGLG